MGDLKGASPDEEITVTDEGGYQSKLEGGFHLVDGRAMFRLAKVLKYGVDKYARNNWRRIRIEGHLNHALMHVYAYLAEDGEDDHLGHAFARMMMAVAMEEEGQVFRGTEIEDPLGDQLGSFREIHTN